MQRTGIEIRLETAPPADVGVAVCTAVYSEKVLAWVQYGKDTAFCTNDAQTEPLKQVAKYGAIFVGSGSPCRWDTPVLSPLTLKAKQETYRDQ